MNKKGKTYILLAIVLGIWGTIGYQVYAKFNPDEQPVVASNTKVTFSPKQAIVKDTFSINTTHRDPFLGTVYQKNQVSSHRKSTKKSSEAIVFPSVLYKGAISKQQSSQNIYILEINGIQQLFKIGKEIDHVKLLKGSKKSVLISFKGVTKQIAVQQ
jgi:hypothetical protein